MPDPDDRTAEPAIPPPVGGEDGLRPVETGDVEDVPPRDADREVEVGDEEERPSDPGGDSDPNPGIEGEPGA